MIYPKCYNGSITPLVTADGFLQPCCLVSMMNYMPYQKLMNEEKVTNIFTDPDFSLYNKTYSEIINSKKWNDMIVGLKHTTIKSCVYHCSSSNAPRNSSVNATEDWSDTRVLTKDNDYIQLETSSRCTLECPYCARATYKTRKDADPNWLNKLDVSLDIIKDVLSFKHWKGVVDCGVHSDPIFYKYYHEMLDIMLGMMIHNYRVSIAATGRTNEWWNETQQLWKHLNDSGINVVVVWGIDGLEDTSSLHRIGQDWNEITTQMKIAAKNGVNSVWQFIPMSFNEQQIDEAKQLARDWNVGFHLKPSDRFGPNDPNKPNDNLHYEIHIENGVTHENNKPREEWIDAGVHIQ